MMTRLRHFTAHALLTAILVLISAQPVCAASDSAELTPAEPVSFVYVHGVNNHQTTSDLMVQQRFEKLHAALLEELREDTAARDILTRSNRFRVAEKPSVFYWGDINQNSVYSLKQELNFFKKNQSRIAAFLQSEVATVIQDFFWLVRQSNQNKIVAALDHHLEQDVPGNHRIVLYAHSGGAIIAFQYLLHYLPYLDIAHFVSQDATIPEAVKQQAEALSLGPTCLNALLSSQLVRFNSQGEMETYLVSAQGEHLTDSDWVEFIDKLEYLKEQSPSVCMPPSRVRGLVTFGNPLFALLPMDKNESGMEAQLSRLLLRHMLENDMFWLNLNRINDPVGYSISNEQIISSLRAGYALSPGSPARGFIYNNVDTSGRIYFYRAHSSYLNRPGAFSRFVWESLKEGAQKSE